LSLLLLLGTVVAIGVLFFQVIRPFVFPLFFAGVLAVLFRPLFLWVNRCFKDHRRIAAIIVTLIVIAVFLLPISGVLTLAGVQLTNAGRELLGALNLPEGAKEARELIDPERNPWMADWASWARDQLSDDSAKQLRELASNGLLGSSRRS
jgi:predicted PurR-regulated permease PerM